jgi:serine/threonine protein kinase/Tol biopolymer transport system component
LNSARDQQIRALYRAALERPPAERASFVAEVSGGDEQLKASIELLLSSDGTTDVGARVIASGADAVELPAGTTVGQYRIDGVLGRGGMGVVYRATDTKLNRPVAIKFLSSVVTDADVRRRFKQEAETTSSLNHPHIVTVFDVGEHDGAQYIVSELVDGGTLDDHATKTRKRSWRQSVELLTGVADALAAAHAAGVLHRDVKPGNILIGSNGYAKLSDFGLAKLVETGPRDSSGRTRSAATRNTRAGVVVGTIAYMSPEQAAGLAVDARSDVFSFGVVLYELIAGRRPFEASNDLETLKAIAHAAPAPLSSDVPEMLRMSLEKALEKEPADRYQTMQDLVADLKRVTRRGSGTQTAVLVTDSRARARTRWLVAGAFAAGLALASIPTARSLLKAPPTPPQRMHFAIPAPGYVADAGLAVSPDGTRIAYVAMIEGARQITIRPIGSLETHVLPGTANVGGLFWSPDSRSIAFFADGKLKRIDVAGGTPQMLADTPVTVPGSWSRNGTILYSQLGDEASSITRIGEVPAVGGVASAVTTAASVPGEPVQVQPRFLPDGKHFVYLTLTIGLAIGTIRVAALDSSAGRSLASANLDPSGSNVAYAEGFLLYMRNRTLLAQRFDVDALALRGEPLPVAENVGAFSAADSGVLVYQANAEAAEAPVAMRRLVWRDRRGERLGEVDAPAGFLLPELSPDARHVSVALRATSGLRMSDVWIVDTQRGVPTRLTFDDAVDERAIWSPDGTRVVFSSGRNGVPFLPGALYERAANGAGADELLYRGEQTDFAVPTDWSRDGKTIAFLRGAISTGPTQIDIWVLSAEDHMATPLLQSPFRKHAARFSPDGRWIAYGTNESGSSQVVVRRYPDVNQGQWQITLHGGYDPRWRADGRELYYLSPDGDVMAVDVQPGEAFETGAPRKLFSTGIAVTFDTTPQAGLFETFYNVSADGERFLIAEPLPAQGAPSGVGAPDESLHVIVNWTSGLGTK